MLDILYRMGMRGKATVHGFRDLASTVLNESGQFQADWIEHQLAHQPRGVRAACNSARYLQHRRVMIRLSRRSGAARHEPDALRTGT
ncbi:hypothetical protein [Flavisphingomonas formosensis]|uniref:hypothetical protein n=1 Tax=Flavisphingomonas formosensis TaxID=861534 RepID=UPI0012F78E2A|nr:hypothetical protein [Sphingomonas formosensis]